MGGLTVGDGRLYVGGQEHDGGAVGLALRGVHMEAMVCQGALPVGPSSFAITASEGNVIRGTHRRGSNPRTSMLCSLVLLSSPACG